VIIAWSRFFVTRQALERTEGTFRVRYLPSGQRVRLVRRVGRGLYVAEPMPAVRPLTMAEAVLRVLDEQRSLAMFGLPVKQSSSFIGKIFVGKPKGFGLYGAEGA
jgi:hypothetical protein